MYFRSLEGLEDKMDGHFIAYHELGYAGRNCSFGGIFSRWLYQTKGSRGASAGWAYSIQELAIAQNKDPEDLFAQYVREFLDGWTK